MSDAQLPIVNRHSYEDFAILDITVTHESPLRGNSGDSSIRFDVGAGSIWLDDDERQVDSRQDFTIRLSGQSEHSVLAEALRQIADDLDAAPSDGIG